MDGILVDVISTFPRLPRQKVKAIIRDESKDLEVTKSVLNLLYNIVIIGSVPVSNTQRAYLDSRSELVRSLLSSAKSLKWKKQQLESNLALVVNIAASCPTVAGL